MLSKNKQLKNLPTQPGIYLFYNTQKEIIYTGKATNLKNRVNSYFKQTNKTQRPIEQLINQVIDIKTITTDSVLEAIILESKYIKKYQPKYNVLGKDNKSWNYLALTKNTYPRLISIRQHELEQIKKQNDSALKKYNLKIIFGPFPELNTKEILKILRKIFKTSTCQPNQGKPCFYYQLGQCSGVCTNEITPPTYQCKVIKPLTMFLRGHKKRLITQLKKEMQQAAKQKNYEEAGRLRDQIINLKKIHDVSLLNKNFFEDKLDHKASQINRLEAYDISHLGSSDIVGSMVVFNNQGPVKSAYRKFKTKQLRRQNDIAAIKEIISRRIEHTPYNHDKNKTNWPLPQIMLIDGGKAQVKAVKIISAQNKYFKKIPVIGIAKGQDRKKNTFIIDENIPQNIKNWIKQNRALLIQARDEAHRFAIQYQKQLRRIKKIKNTKKYI